MFTSNPLELSSYKGKRGQTTPQGLPKKSWSPIAIQISGFIFKQWKKKFIGKLDSFIFLETSEVYVVTSLIGCSSILVTPFTTIISDNIHMLYNYGHILIIESIMIKY